MDQRESPERSGATEPTGSKPELSGPQPVLAAIPQTELDIGTLIRQHHAALYRYAFRLTGNVPDAEDLTQQAFLTAQGKLHQVRDPDRVLGWLYAVLRSCFLKACRKQRPQSATAADVQVDQIPDDVVEEPLIDRQQLDEALRQLPDDSRAVLLMFYFEDASYKQIAAALEVPIGTVMSRLTRAKSRLRRVLLDEPAGSAAPWPENGSDASGRTGQRAGEGPKVTS